MPSSSVACSAATSSGDLREVERDIPQATNLSRAGIDPHALALLPSSLITEHRVVPIAFGNNRLTLAMTNPSNVVAFDDVRRTFKGVLIEPVVVTEEDLWRFLATTYVRQTATAEPPGRSAGKAPAPDPRATIDLLQSDLVRELRLAADPEDQLAAESKQDLMSASEDAPIVRLANSILGLAIKQEASDIHVEPMEGELTMRFRVDGELEVVRRLPKRVQRGMPLFSSARA